MPSSHGSGVHYITIEYTGHDSIWIDMSFLLSDMGKLSPHYRHDRWPESIGGEFQILCFFIQLCSAFMSLSYLSPQYVVRSRDVKKLISRKR